MPRNRNTDWRGCQPVFHHRFYLKPVINIPGGGLFYYKTKMKTLAEFHKNGGEVKKGDIVFFKSKSGFRTCLVISDNFKKVIPDYTGYESYHTSTVSVIVEGEVKQRDLTYSVLYKQI